MADTAFQPKIGSLTFDAEGNNDPSSVYFSRRAHVPSPSSGVTIGRGYDMKHRSKDDILKDLISAGVPQGDSKELAEGSGLVGSEATVFISKKEIKKIEISEEAQTKLFEITFQKYFDRARIICQKAKIEAKYGKCDWKSMDKKVQELIADLIYRGDYTPTTRAIIQEPLINGKVEDIIKALDQLKNIPSDRQKRRKSHLLK